MKTMRGGGGWLNPPVGMGRVNRNFDSNFFPTNIRFVEKVFDMYAVRLSSLFSQIVGLF